MTSVKNALSKTLSFGDFYFSTDSKVTLTKYQQSKENTKHFYNIEYKRSEILRMFINGFIATLKKILLIY